MEGEGMGRGEGRVGKGRIEGGRGREKERRGGEGRGRGLPSIPPIPNLPLHHWSMFPNLSYKRWLHLARLKLSVYLIFVIRPLLLNPLSHITKNAFKSFDQNTFRRVCDRPI